MFKVGDRVRLVDVQSDLYRDRPSKSLYPLKDRVFEVAGEENGACIPPYILLKGMEYIGRLRASRFKLVSSYEKSITIFPLDSPESGFKVVGEDERSALENALKMIGWGVKQ